MPNARLSNADLYVSQPPQKARIPCLFALEIFRAISPAELAIGRRRTHSGEAGQSGGKHYRYYNSAALAEWMENCWGGVLDGKIIRIPNVLISLG